MAIKGDRQVDSDELAYFVNTATSPGKILSVSTGGSGIAMDSTSNVAAASANSSGAKPLGMLLTEVVNIDLARQHINWHKSQVNIGNKARIMTKGWAVTDQVTSATAGTKAVLSSSGYVTNKASTGHNEVVNPTVGVFRSGKDANGFAKVYIDL